MKIDRTQLLEIINKMNDDDFKQFSEHLSAVPVISKYIGTYNDTTYTLCHKATDFLTSMGFSAHRKGFQYFRTGLGIAIYEPDVFGNKITLLYKAIAKRHNTTWYAVEKACRDSIAEAYETNYDAFPGMGCSLEPPKPKKFFAYAVSELSK